MRFTIQEMKDSGFTYYQVIDTENGCQVMHTTKDYNEPGLISEHLLANVIMRNFYASL